jgi:GNAT superfamily N-acetyltransferase
MAAPEVIHLEALQPAAADVPATVSGSTGGTLPAPRSPSEVVSAALEDRDPDYTRRWLPLTWRLLAAWFRPDIRGLDRIPGRGSVALVGNHSGGTIPVVSITGQETAQHPFDAVVSLRITGRWKASGDRRVLCCGNTPGEARNATGLRRRSTVHERAFAPLREEAEIVEALRASSAHVPQLYLVALVDGRLVGHIAFSRGALNSRLGVLMLGQVGVLPERQRQGFGSALVTVGLRRAFLSGGQPTHRPHLGSVRRTGVGCQGALRRRRRRPLSEPTPA